MRSYPGCSYRLVRMPHFPKHIQPHRIISQQTCAGGIWRARKHADLGWPAKHQDMDDLKLTVRAESPSTLWLSISCKSESMQWHKRRVRSQQRWLKTTCPSMTGVCQNQTRTKYRVCPGFARAEELPSPPAARNCHVFATLARGGYCILDIGFLASTSLESLSTYPAKPSFSKRVRAPNHLENH